MEEQRAMICPQCGAENRPDSRFCHKCATPLTTAQGVPVDRTLTLERPPVGLSRGTLFAGRYEVIEELGWGGMGRVYRVYDQKIQEIVALKLIHSEISLNEKAIDRFRNELRFARKIGHRHVCRMFDLGEDDHQFYITMEYVEGENLKSFIRRSGQLAPRKAISLARQVCEGLAEAHRLGIIHRDLKPQNIMIDREGSARIMDFGIARFTESEGLTGSGVVIGTPEYMAPEQAETKDVDKRADLYALGVILYEMVTGSVPFEGETPLAVLIKHRHETPRDPQQSNPLVSEALTQLILKCLQKDKTRRYQSAEELSEDLTLAEKGLFRAEKEVMAKHVPGPKILSKRWFRLAVGILGACFVLIVLGQFLKKETGRHEVRDSAQGKRVYVSRPPQPLPGAGSATGKSPDAPAEKSRSVLSFLSPDSLRKMSQKELQELLNFDKQMMNIKGAIPKGEAFYQAWDSFYSKIREGRRLDEEGRVDEARKMKREGQDEMQRLLGLVAQREKALEAKSILADIKKRVSEMNVDQKNVLYRVASRREQDAEDAFHNSDFSGSRILNSVLEMVYGLSGKCEDDEKCLAGLAESVVSLRKTAESMAPAALDPWLLEKAKESESNAQKALAQKDYDSAADSYIQAAFLYQKALDQAK
jgi:serine/threonine-protein kinase